MDINAGRIDAEIARYHIEKSDVTAIREALTDLKQNQKDMGKELDEINTRLSRIEGAVGVKEGIK